MRMIIAALLLLLGLATASAEDFARSGATQNSAPGVVILCNTTAKLYLPCPSALAPASGTPTQASVTCGTGSTTLLAAGAAAQFLTIKVPSTAANPVWFRFDGSAATTSSPSLDLTAGQSMTWGTASGFLPTALDTCIASAPTVVTLIYK